jgi:hypothetical protein
MVGLPPGVKDDCTSLILLRPSEGECKSVNVQPFRGLEAFRLGENEEQGNRQVLMAKASENTALPQNLGSFVIPKTK